MTASDSLRHGEAVAIGIALDATYSLWRGPARDGLGPDLDASRRARIRLWHRRIAAPTSSSAGLEEFREHLGGRLTILMLRAIGEPFDVHEIHLRRMRDALESRRARA